MMPANLNEESLRAVREQIYGHAKTDAAICIQLEKLDRYLSEHRGFKPDTFDTFDYA
ncbi:hypothetical protein [Candidatus Nitrosotenuis aquarius]|uniref:hypothetical protein n=1 Tax=Candidatus Nitrosotenuis aquarius TaxID=1846278 RepID=UPI0013C3606F|nr:hypothetical protein [Candidatus Nitrosotenuis aquarius]